jgi:hypothetical protein
MPDDATLQSLIADWLKANHKDWYFERGEFLHWKHVYGWVGQIRDTQFQFLLPPNICIKLDAYNPNFFDELDQFLKIAEWAFRGSLDDRKDCSQLPEVLSRSYKTGYKTFF